MLLQQRPGGKRAPFLVVLGLLSARLAAAQEGGADVPARQARQEIPTNRQAAPPGEQGAEAPGWFGVPLPPRLGDTPAILVGERGPHPVTLPIGEPLLPELDGRAIRADVDAIVEISKWSRREREIGSGQLWGRISGLPSGARASQWAAGQLRKAGVADVRVQPVAQDPRASLWLPLSWEVRLLGDSSFGAGTTDVVLESAMPLPPSELPRGTLTAPLVFVGGAGPALLSHIDVKGKIAVQLVVPQAHMVFERDLVISRAQELMKAGAVAVLNLMRQPGNELARDFSNCGGPCFNVGGRDGFFLERVLDRASRTGADAQVRAQLSLKAEVRTGLAAENVVAIIPGRTDENLVIDAHVDAWFDGAGDNADGLAVLIALARHFAQPAHRPERSLVLIASAGHHTPGLNGPRAFVATNPQLASKAVLLLNVEHVAQRNFSPARSVGPDGYREFVADAGEAPVVAGVSNQSPFLDRLFDEGATRYGVNFVSARSSMATGETLGFAALDVARVTVMQAPPLYHTSGEGLDVISTPGLERMARFLAHFIRETAKATRAQINP